MSKFLTVPLLGQFKEKCSIKGVPATIRMLGLEILRTCLDQTSLAKHADSPAVLGRARREGIFELSKVSGLRLCKEGGL